VLVIALCKGRFLEPSLAALEKAGIRFPEDVANSRKLIFETEDKRFRAIAGRDVIMESRADLLQPLDLNFGQVKIAIAGPKGSTSIDGSDHPTVRVATKYPRITLDYYNARGIPVEIIPLSGSIELAPLIGLADRIVDLVETGRTLKENGLEVVEVIAESTARLLVNRAGYQTKRDEVLQLITSLEKVVQCGSST
jgi:ATP phosphoribosyltransferase